MADSTTILVPSLELVTPGPEEADLAAVAFLARYRRPELQFRTRRAGSLGAPWCERVGDHTAVSS